MNDGGETTGGGGGGGGGAATPNRMCRLSQGLLVEVHAKARPMDLPKEGDEVLEGPPSPTTRPRGGHVELAACCAQKHAVERRSLSRSLAPLMPIAELLHNLPNAPLGHGQQLAARVLYVVSVCAYPSVDRPFER